MIEGKYQKVGKLPRKDLEGDWLADNGPVKTLGEERTALAKAEKVNSPSPVTRKNCKRRPASNKSKGGGSRSYAKWC